MGTNDESGAPGRGSDPDTLADAHAAPDRTRGARAALHERYELRELLGVGGMGEVRATRDTQIAQPDG